MTKQCTLDKDVRSMLDQEYAGPPVDRWAIHEGIKKVQNQELELDISTNYGYLATRIDKQDSSRIKFPRRNTFHAFHFLQCVDPQWSEIENWTKLVSEGRFDHFVSQSTHLISSTATHTSHSSEPETRSLKEQLLFIRKVFGISTTDIASLFGYSRPTIYSWLAGTEPSRAVIKVIIRVLKVAEEFESLQVSRPELVVKRPIFDDGKSFLDLLTDGQEVTDKYKYLVELDKKEGQSRRKDHFVGRPLKQERVIDSTPIYPK